MHQASTEIYDEVLEKDKNWSQLAILQTAKSFQNKMLAPVNFSEAQIHHMWNMTYSAFEGSSIKALVCEKTGNASTIRKNTIRVSATSEKRTNRLMGHRIDTIYGHEDYELGCIEIGKDSVSTTDNKYHG